MIRIAIVDDHPIIRSSLKQFFSLEVDLKVVAEAASAGEAVELISSVECDVLMLDLVLPGQNGISVLKKVRTLSPQLKTLVYSGLPEEPYAVDVIREGASAFLSKQCSPEELLDAVRMVATGSRYITASVLQLLERQGGMREALYHQLSAREMEVFLRLAQGSHAHEVAAELGISQKTVSTYRYRILEKLGLSTNSAMTSYALGNGLIQ